MADTHLKNDSCNQLKWGISNILKRDFERVVQNYIVHKMKFCDFMTIWYKYGMKYGSKYLAVTAAKQNSALWSQGGQQIFFS